MTTDWDARPVRVGDVTLRCYHLRCDQRRCDQRRCDQAGDPGAPPVLLLHGGASDATTWARLAARLGEAGRCVVAPDLRGHGGSSRPRRYPLEGFRDDVAGLLDVLGLAEVAVVGHSLGAYVALGLAAATPTRVSRLVLEEPPVRPRAAGDERPVSGPGAWARFAVSGAIGLLGRHRFDPAAVRSAVAQLRRPDPLWWESLRRVTAPALVVCGGPSSHLSPRRTAELAEALPDATLVTVPAGHRVHSLRPEEFEAAVLPFLTAPAGRP